MSSKVLAAIVVVIAVGFGVGWASANYMSRDEQPTSADEMHALLSHALDMKSTLERSGRIVRLGHAVGPETLPGVARAFEERLNSVEPFDFKIFAEVWASHDPDNLLRTVDQWPSDRHQHIAMGAALRAWFARGEADQALAHVRTLTERAERLSGLTSLMDAWVETDPNHSMDEFIVGFGDENDRNMLAGMAATLIVQSRGESQLRDWINRIPADSMPDHKSMAFRRAVTALTRRNPESASNWVTETENEPWATGGRTALLRAWCAFDPSAASDWALKIKDSQGQARAVEMALRLWARQEPGAVAAWIGQQAPAPLFDSSLEHIALRYSANNPKRAIELAERIQDTDRRSSTRKRIEATARN